MNDNKREMLSSFMLCKEPPARQEYWLHIVAIEDDEERYVTKIRAVKSLLIYQDCLARIARPEGYVYIWQREHGKKPLMFDPDLSSIETMPKSQRSIKDYEDEIGLFASIAKNKLFAEDGTSTPKKSKTQRDIESQDSQQAQSNKSWAEYQLWRKKKGLVYDANEMNRCWQGYCAYREKYGLKPVTLEPKT